MKSGSQLVKRNIYKPAIYVTTGTGLASDFRRSLFRKKYLK